MTSTTQAVRKRPAKKPAHARLVKTVDPEASQAPREPADFVVDVTREVDAQMWPLHPVVWLQPELRPALPGSSGLRIEHYHRIPSPGFSDVEIAALDRSHAIEEYIPFEFPPGLRPVPPSSDLAPLGWDPRAVGRQHRNEVEK